jgi:adenine-specific DNA-methyltransferase
MDQPIVRLLDPAAGAGILATAVVETLLSKETKPAQIHVVIYELDARLRTALERLAEKMRRAGTALGVKISVTLCFDDFLMSTMACEQPAFDIVIANPPYFKLNKDDRRALKHAYAVYGQPNIYGLFMAACARLLLPGGRWCFITPRSWTNGTYFAAVRRQILLWLHIDAMHVFESRQEHFTDDEVLQEAMITWATAQAGRGGTVVISTSAGISDLGQATLRTLPTCDIVGADNHNNVIALPTVEELSALRGFTANLSTHGLKVSTGPVVAFRAAIYMTERGSRGTVPLLWMQHVQHMSVSWPIQKKYEHIAANADTAWMLVPNANMVVMRRFSPKEDRRRVTAAPYIAGSIPGSVLGLENHTNYIYRPGGDLLPEEAKGLAAFLNSRAVDSYFRAVAGNTQVNAADLRALPLPPLNQLIEIGRSLPDTSTLDEADLAVETTLGIRLKAGVA